MSTCHAHVCYFMSRAVKAAVEGTEEEEEHRGMDGSPGGANAEAPAQSACSSQHEDAGTASLFPSYGWKQWSSSRHEGPQPTASPGADGDPSVSQWSGEQLHNCRFQGSNGFGDRWPSLVCLEKWRMGTKSSVRWHGSPGSVVWKSGQLHNRQTEEALKRGY